MNTKYTLAKGILFQHDTASVPNFCPTLQSDLWHFFVMEKQLTQLSRTICLLGRQVELIHE